MVVCPLLALLILSLSSGFPPEVRIFRNLHYVCISLVVLLAKDDGGIPFINLFFFTGWCGEGIGIVSVRVLKVVFDGVPPLGFTHSFCLIYDYGMG